MQSYYGSKNHCFKNQFQFKVIHSSYFYQLHICSTVAIHESAQLFLC